MFGYLSWDRKQISMTEIVRARGESSAQRFKPCLITYYYLISFRPLGSLGWREHLIAVAAGLVQVRTPWLEELLLPWGWGSAALGGLWQELCGSVCAEQGKPVPASAHSQPGWILVLIPDTGQGPSLSNGVHGLCPGHV